LVGLCLALFLPGLFSLPPFDRDEARYAQASRQMLESGDFVDIRFQGEARHKKPVGIYWLQAGAVAVVTAISDTAANEIWPYRLPSVLGAMAAVLLTAWTGTALFGRGAAFLGAVMLAGCVVLGVEARMAKTDAVLLATIIAAQGALARLYLERARPLSNLARAGRPLPGGDGAGGGDGDGAGPGRLEAWMADWAWPLVFWVATGLAVLIKGPVGPLVSVTTVVALIAVDREARWLLRLRPMVGLMIVAAIVAPWLVAITLKSHGGFYAESVGHDWLGKVFTGQEGKGLPPGYYVASFWLTFAPFAGFALLAVPWVWHHRREPAVRFCLAWIIPTWIVFELIRTKLLHYTLPTFPAIALLTAQATMDRFGWANDDDRRERDVGGVRGAGRRLVALAAVLGVVVAIALPVGLAVIAALVDQRFLGLAVIVGAIAGALTAAAYQRLRASPVVASGRVLAAMAVVYGLCYPFALPAIDGIWVSRSVAAAVAAHERCPDTPVAAAGYSEPSLVFLLGTATKLGDGGAAAGHLIQHPACGLAVVERRHEADFVAALGGRATEVLATVTGFNYSNGKPVMITLHRLATAP